MSLSHIEFVVVGAGGLGCPALLGLAAAGARRLTVVDHDRVEASNLPRQVLFETAMVGSLKTRAAAVALRLRHRDVRLHEVPERLDASGVSRFVAGLSKPVVVLECTDDPSLKFAFNDACLAVGVPLVVGAALGWSGQAMAVLAGHACYRCIFEDPPRPDLIPTCEMAGVIGPTVGHVGGIMVGLAIGLGANRPDTAGRLLAVDTLTASTTTLAPAPRGSCPACRASPRHSQDAATVQP